MSGRLWFVIVALPGLFSYLFLQLYLDFVKYQLGLHRKVQVFAKCNVCISDIYRHVQAFFSYIEISLVLFFSDSGVSRVRTIF